MILEVCLVLALAVALCDSHGTHSNEEKLGAFLGSLELCGGGSNPIDSALLLAYS